MAAPIRNRPIHPHIEVARLSAKRAVADILGMPQSTVSSHVQIIRKAGLLESEKCEKWTYFRIFPRHRKLLLSLDENFPGMTDQCQADAVKLAERLDKREQSCCPRPKHITSKPRKTTTK